MKEAARGKIEKATFKIFLFCLLACASLFLINIWILRGPDSEHETFLKIMLTLFAVGLANFLIWVSMMIYKLVESKK